MTRRSTSTGLLCAWLACAVGAGCSGGDAVTSATGGTSGGGSGGSATGTGGAGTGGARGTGGVTGGGSGGSASGGAAGGGSGGRGSGGAGAGGSGGVVADGGTPADGGNADGGGTSCAAGRFAICEDFEATAVGAIPSGWAKAPSSTTNVQVASDQAYRGSHALKMLAQQSGARTITKTATQLGALAAAHWGRMFYRVQTPAPAPPSGGVIHSTLVSLSGTSPLPVADSVNVRVVDTVVRDFDGKHQFLYNVQPSTRGEFATEGPYNWTYESKWHCVEWYVSYATQSYRFFFDSAEVTQMAINNGAGKFNGSEIPAAFSIAFGWNNYQAAGTGYVAWIDEIAMDASRVGCDN